MNPTWPEEAQEITLPTGSVIDTIVLLKVLLMWACPWAMFLRSFRRTFLAAPVRLFGGICFLFARSSVRSADYFLPAFFLPATVFLRPLRVRALVWVRWPWTGSPRRWRMPW